MLQMPCTSQLAKPPTKFFQSTFVPLSSLLFTCLGSHLPFTIVLARRRFAFSWRICADACMCPLLHLVRTDLQLLIDRCAHLSHTHTNAPENTVMATH
eukprot:m.11156 g.11156  ORF g.11156 m.11156 type:complete len:98 (+) comp5678_c0_seq1:1425-1718(+)